MNNYDADDDDNSNNKIIIIITVSYDSLAGVLQLSCCTLAERSFNFKTSSPDICHSLQ